MRAVNTQIHATLVSSAVGFALSILLTPVISRLYGPGEYGIFAAVNGVATIIAAASLMSLPNALAISNSMSVRCRLMATLVKLSLIGMLATALLLILVSKAAPSSANWFAPWMLLACPILVLAICASRILTSLSISTGLFRAQVHGRFAYAFLTRPLSVVLGLLLPAKSWLMVVSESLGFLGQAAVTARDLRQPLRRFASMSRLRDTSIWQQLKRHNTFSAYDYPTQMLVITNAVLPALILAWRFGPQDAGLLTLALSVLAIPNQLIALAVAPALLFRVREWAERGDKAAASALRLAFQLIAGMAVAGYASLWLVAPWFLPIFLGPQWGQSGQIAGWFCLAFAIQFTVTPFEATYWFSGHTKSKLIIYACGFVATLVALASPLSQSSTEAIAHFAIVLSAQRLAELLLLARSAGTVERTRSA